MFRTEWEDGCNKLSLEFSQLTYKYPKHIFVCVDVEQCEGTALENTISKVP